MLSIPYFKRILLPRNEKKSPESTPTRAVPGYSPGNILYFFNPRTQFWTSCADAPESKRFPSCQAPVLAAAAKFLPLSDKGDMALVAKGITVLPVKSCFSTKA